MGSVIAFPDRTKSIVENLDDGGVVVTLTGDAIHEAMDAYLKERPFSVEGRLFLFDEYDPGKTDDELFFYGVEILLEKGDG
jgi:hypothetical protein